MLISVSGIAIGLPPVTSAAMAQTASPTAIPRTDMVSDTKDIIVTANRREELSQDVPITITTMSSQRLEQLGITKEQDLQATVPSLAASTNNIGARDATSFTIRGQGATYQASPGVVVYLGEVPLPAAITVNQQGGPGNFVDLENVQVLSGPQGTLFGRNTTGGAVLLAPKKPTNSLGGWLRAETGNYERAYVEGALNMPIVDDQVLLRVVGAYHSRRGYTYDVAWDKFRDNENWHSGRVGLTLRPSETFENYTLAYFGRSRNNGAGIIHTGFDISGLKGFGFCADAPASPGPISVPCDVYREATADAERLGVRQTRHSMDDFQYTKTWGINNTTNLDLSDDILVRNIISFQKLKIDYGYDADATVLQQQDIDPRFLLAPGRESLPLLGTPLTYAFPTQAGHKPLDDLKQFTEELQVQGKSFDGHLQWTIGGFYYDQRPAGEQGTRTTVFCPAAFTGFCEPSFTEYGLKTVSKALYAQATLGLEALSPALDRFSLTGGYRYTWDRLDGFASRYGRSATDPTAAVCGTDSAVVPFATAARDCRFTRGLRSKAPSWLIGLDVKVTPDVLLFAKVNRGYKAGGFNQYSVRPGEEVFGPETVTSYEAGIKSSFRLGATPVRLNVTGYTVDYQNIQRTMADFNPTSRAGGARVVTPSARIKGLEIEASARPFSGMELGGNAAFSDGEYKSFLYVSANGGIDCNGPVAPGGTADSGCVPMANLPKVTYSLFGSFDHKLGDDLGSLNLYVNYTYSAARYVDNSQVPAAQPGAFLESFGLLNASLDWRNVGGGPVDIGLFGTNLTKATYRVANSTSYQALFYSWALYGEPRMYGIRAKVRFGGE